MIRRARGRVTDPDTRSLHWRLLVPPTGYIHLGAVENFYRTSCGAYMNPDTTEIRIPELGAAAVGCRQCQRTYAYRRYRIDRDRIDRNLLL